MNMLVRVSLVLGFCAAVITFLPGCGERQSATLVAAPPGPAELGPASGLSAAPSNAVVFDLKYLPQTGRAEDIQYHAYWGYGGSESEAKKDPFIQEVRQKASNLHFAYNPSLKGRAWAAVEYHGRQATALYFDLNGDGKLGTNECILPTRKTTGQGIEFITPDFLNPLAEGGQMLCRVLLQVNFYNGSEPSSMWSPAAVLEGTAKLEGRPARFLLYANNPGGSFEQYGSSSYSLLLGDQLKTGEYVPREQLSSLIASEGQFYRLKIEGRRANGLPARAVVVKDTSPTGTLAVKLVGANALQAAFSSVFLSGVEDKTVVFRTGAAQGKVVLPAGSYALDDGTVAYGTANSKDWELSFSRGPRATVKAGEVCELSLGQPTLAVRAIKEQDRYNGQATELTTFKRGTRIYLEPRILGKGQEVFSRFQQIAAANGRRTACPPKITITAPDGRQVLSATMEYG